MDRILDDQPGRRIGDLASLSGLTVRTLHHYEDIGLLSASGRTAAGHRVYTEADVQRLYRIALLRRLGLRLAVIGRLLDDPAWEVRCALRAHLDEVQRELVAATRIRSRLMRLLAYDDETAPITDDLLALLKEMETDQSNLQGRISILVYADLEAAFVELTDVFGLGPGQLMRDERGRVVHGEIHAGDGGRGHGQAGVAGPAAGRGRAPLRRGRTRAAR